MNNDYPFTSASLAEHLLRGLLGFGAIIAALLSGAEYPLAALALFVLALLVMRGCPSCWTIGLIGTCRLRGRPAPKD